MASLDGYFVDVKGDMSWEHNTKTDKEWNRFIEGNAKGGGVLLFCRITYELTAGYWPTKLAHQYRRPKLYSPNGLIHAANPFNFL